ncbi:MAG: DUF3995 domain-containing protein, partial [Rhodospirillales bacterium]|nr:DUF3995 domain-containing protein [Rhodospirillales bacterium]
PPVACLLAAAAVAVAAVWPMLLVATATTAPPRAVIVGVGAAIAVVFLLRGVAGYLPAWRRRFATEPFAMRDITLFSPLCFIIAAGYGALLLPGVVK